VWVPGNGVNLLVAVSVDDIVGIVDDGVVVVGAGAHVKFLSHTVESTRLEIILRIYLASLGLVATRVSSYLADHPKNFLFSWSDLSPFSLKIL
jgi:hypothetical protein